MIFQTHQYRSKINSTFMTFKLSILLIFSFFGCIANAQEVETLKGGQSSGAGQLTDMAWLVGYWKGTGLGGECEELWMPKMDNGMHGVFRLQKEGKLVFTEYMVIEAVEQSLTVKIKHFGRGVVPWEDKEEWSVFRLVRMDGQSAFFDGITFKRSGDALHIFVNIENEGKVSVEKFTFKKAVL
jgi:hypothetical protein